MTKKPRTRWFEPTSLDKDAAPLTAAIYREEPWRGQPMTGRYEDADVSGEQPGPAFERPVRHSGMASAAQRCVEEGEA